MLDEFPKIVTIDQNEDLDRIFSIYKVKAVVVGLNRHSARGQME